MGRRIHEHGSLRKDPSLRSEIKPTPAAFWRKVEEARATVSEPPFFEIGNRTTCAEILEFDRAMEDAGFRYYLREATPDERDEFEKMGGEIGALAGVKGALMVSITVLVPGVRIRQPEMFCLDRSMLLGE